MSADGRPERIRAILDELIRQRQRLRSTGAEAGLLEANRLGILYWQWQLSRTLSGDGERSGAAA